MAIIGFRIISSISTFIFMDMEIHDGELIERVSQIRLLYDKRHPDFKNKLKKENAWSTIALLVGAGHARQCEGRWNALRHKYTTIKRESKCRPSGSKAISVPWPYMKLMEFLDPYIMPRKTTTNYDQDAENTAYSYRGLYESADDVAVELTGENDETQIEETILIDEENVPMPESEVLVSPEDMRLYSEYAGNAMKTPSSSTLKRTLEPPNTNTTATKNRRTNISSSTEKQILSRLDNCFGTIGKLVKENKVANTETEAGEEHFAKSLAGDLKCFTPREKIIVKFELYKCLNKLIREKELGEQAIE